LIRRFRKGFIRKVLYKKKSIFLKSNRPVLQQNKIYIYSLKSSIISKRQFEKFLLYLKWFKRDQKKNFRLTPLFNLKIHPIFFSTKKSLGMRMGKGKGPKNFFFCKIHSKSFFFEVKNLLPCYVPLFIKKIKYFLHFKCYVKYDFDVKTPFLSRLFYNDKLLRHFRKKKK
jgi:ribosomal protein L16/L10AE